MKIETVRENVGPFGTEYSCMMMMVLDGRLVVVRAGTEEFDRIADVVRSSERLARDKMPKEATSDDIAFFVNRLRETGPRAE